MDTDAVYEYIEEAGKRELMEILDAVINRFRELHDDRELIAISLSTGEKRNEEWERAAELLHGEIGGAD